MLKIIRIEKNPKRKYKKISHEITIVSFDKSGKTITDIVETSNKNAGRFIKSMSKDPENGFIATGRPGMKLEEIAKKKRAIAHKNPNRKTKKKMAVKRKRKVICARKNPSQRKRHETMIVGFDHGRGRKTKKYWFTGESFSRNRDDARIYSGDGAKLEAKRILNRLPPAIYGIKVETV